MRKTNEIEATASKKVADIAKTDAAADVQCLGIVAIYLRAQLEVLFDCRELLVDIRHNTTGSRHKRGGDI
jgi:hypothetical protein